MESGQLHRPVGHGRSDRDVILSDHRGIDPDLNPRHGGVGTVNRHEGSSVRLNDTTPTGPPASDSRTGVVLTGGRTLVVLRRGDAPDPRHPATADPRSANPRLCVIRCDPRPAARVAGPRLGHQFPEPGQPRPGEPTPEPADLYHEP